MNPQQPNDSELTREQFARLAGPIRNYFISNGVDDLTAGLQAANITEAQRGAVEAIIQDEILKARIDELETLGRVAGHVKMLWGGESENYDSKQRLETLKEQLNQPNTNKEKE